MSEPATILSRQDLLEMLYTSEHLARLEATIANLQFQLRVAQKEHAEAKTEHGDVNKKLAEAYGLDDSCSVDSKTGAITRRKK